MTHSPASGVRPLADVGQNPVFERLDQGFGMTSGPREMQEVVGVKVQVDRVELHPDR